MDHIFDALFILLGIWMGVECYKGLRSGVARGRRASYPRESSPALYWVHIGVQAVFGVAMIVAGLLNILRAPS